MIPAATAREEKLAWFLVCGSDVVIHGFSGLLRHLEPDGLAGLSLTHVCTIDRTTVGSDIFDPEVDDVASSQFAADREIEHRQVADTARHLQFFADRPDVLRPEGRLGDDQFRFVPG
ncbi:MAG TPA: hypothetical protein VGF39_07380 [Stellaceae bacterium]